MKISLRADRSVMIVSWGSPAAAPVDTLIEPGAQSSGCRGERDSAPSQPLAQERVEQVGPACGVASNVTLVGDQAIECVLERGARNPMFLGDSAAGWRLSVGQRQQDDPLGAPETVPDGLMGIAGLAE